MGTTPTRCWFWKTPDRKEGYTAVDVFALLAAMEMGEECLLRLRLLDAYTRDLKNRVDQLIAEMRVESGSPGP